MPLTLLTWALALSPIVVVLVLMVGLRWGAAQAGPAGWLVAVVVAVSFFGGGPRLLAYSQLRGILLTLFVLYIIWMALLLYHVVNEAGAIEAIGEGIARLTADRTWQILILAWVFSSFLQGVTGFGVPVAVVAPLLIGLGFEPIAAVVTTSIGHSWAVTFGSVASSFYALMAVTGLSGPSLAPWTAVFLGVCCFLCGLFTAHAYDGLRALRRAVLPVLLVGAVMALSQYLLATLGLWNLAAALAGLIGLAVMALLVRSPLYRPTVAAGAADPGAGPTSQGMPFPLAVSAYLVLIAVVVLAELYPPLDDFLNGVVVRVSIPETSTAFGWVNPAGTGRTISVFGHAGALIAYSAVIAFFIYRRFGRYESATAGRILSNTVRGAIRSSVGIAFMVGMALAMSDSGMVFLLAKGLSQAVGSAFPLAAPFIGGLGAFMTGSNTNSNVLFGSLQQSTAELLGLNVLIILGAQTAGGAIGGMFAPAKVIVGCSTAGLAGQEGRVMKVALAYGIAITGLLSLLAWLAVLTF